jgi:sarcosine oxidase subunit gamma
MTGDSPGRRGHESRLTMVDGSEVFLTQIDVRVHRAEAERLPLLLPVEANTWTGWNNREILWLGPDEWLMLAKPDSREPGQLIAELETLLSGTHHSVVDVSANRTVLELAGEDRFELLSAGCGLDLHPRFWGDGMCAQTLLARVPVILQERRQGTRVLVRASFANHLVAWLLHVGGAGDSASA